MYEKDYLIFAITSRFLLPNKIDRAASIMNNWLRQCVNEYMQLYECVNLLMQT